MSARRFDPPPALLVEADAGERPWRFVWRGRSEQIVAIEATWEETAGWWRGAGATTARRCYRVRTHAGLRCLVYHERDTNGWTLGAILD
jgi:hypothetical protein